MTTDVLKVVLVEDDPASAYLIQELVADVRAMRLEMQHVERLSEALELIRHCAPHVMLLDLSLPDVQGPETVIRANAAAPGVAIVVLTSLDDEQTALRAMQAGAQDYLIKGTVDAALLGRSIRYAIERKRAEESYRQLVREQAARAAAEEAEDRLRRGEERLRLALHAGRMGYFDLALESRRMLLSARLARMLGGPEQEELSFSVEDLLQAIHPEDRPATAERLQRLLQSHCEGDSFEYRVRHPDGAIHWLEQHSYLVRDDAGQPLRLIGVALDVTERHEASDRLQRLVDDLTRSNGELEQFAYVASHDLQEPLRMVTSYAQLLARRYRGRLDTNADEFIGFLVEGVSRMKCLIQDLLSYSRVGTRRREPVPVPCESVLERVRTNLEAATGESHAEIRADPLPVVMGDPLQLEQLLQNLITNALKFRSGAPPRVHISAEPQGDHYLFRVHDNGIGIEPEYFERIFIIFQRLNERSEYPGTGIGLSICKKIVECHGGRIWVESTPGQGSTFLFTLKAGAPALEGARHGVAGAFEASPRRAALPHALEPAAWAGPGHHFR